MGSSCLLSILLAALMPAAQEDAFRGACDQAAANLAASKNKEVVAMLEPALKDAALAKSPNRDRLCYYLGCAAFALEQDVVAGRALSRLTPFEASPYAPHARYLLGRLHHRAGEYSEAAAHYDAVPAAYEKQLAAAKQALGNAAALKDKPAEKAFLENYVKGPPPDYVAEAIFHSGVLLYEMKGFPDALTRFVLFSQKDKRPAWQEENRLRIGMCQVRMSQNGEALKTLQPLQDHAKLARVARWWMARAILSTPEGKPADAAEHLKKAAAAPEVESGPPTPEILITLGDALERANKGAEAVGVYQQLVAQGGRAEEALARLVGAHVAVKQYREADAAADKFEKTYPGSPMLADVLMKRADSTFAEAQAANKPELFAEALKRYERVLAGGGAANAARYRMAVAQYRLGKLPAALESLRAIPEAERGAELAAASYLQAECLLRTTLPAEDALDAVAAEGALQNLQEAAGLLQKFLPGAGPQAPEVMMKLAHALRQSAALLGEPGERVAAANSARELYEAFRNQFPNHALRPVAEYERANCYALAGDVNTALQKLERFKTDPMAASAVAPLALLRQAQLYRSIGQPQPAAQILADCRARHEAALLKDPARVSWVPLLRYHQAAALKELKQMAEAAQILESVVKEYGASEWADPSRRLLKEVKP